MSTGHSRAHEARVILEPPGGKPCQSSRPGVDANKLCGLMPGLVWLALVKS